MRDYFDILNLNDLQCEMQESDHLISMFRKMLSVELTEINFWLFASDQMTANHHKSFQSLGYFQYGKYDFKILWSEKAALTVSNCLLILTYFMMGNKLKESQKDKKVKNSTGQLPWDSTLISVCVCQPDIIGFHWNKIHLMKRQRKLLKNNEEIDDKKWEELIFHSNGNAGKKWKQHTQLSSRKA